MARRLEPDLTWAKLLNRWAVNAGIHLRRRLRKAGIDPDSVAGPEPSSPIPDVIPPPGGKCYEHVPKRKRRKRGDEDRTI